MAKGSRGRRGIASRQCRPTPYPLPSYEEKDDILQKSFSKIFKNDWEDATCSVCMECPHNAVLLLCSSHEKGCRPYMCGTSFRYSNCLDQYKKAYTKVTVQQSNPLRDLVDSQVVVDPFFDEPLENSKVTELACPLCRGQVKGWTVVEPAREYLNTKKRNCMQDNCSFVGSYKELRKHVKAEHPSAKPHEVDPSLERKWGRLEREREREDVLSTIRSSMPGAMVFGDYVIEGSHYSFDSDDEGLGADTLRWNEAIDAGMMSVVLLLQAFGAADNDEQNRGTRQLERDSNNSLDRSVMRLSRESRVNPFDYSESEDDDEFNRNSGTSLVSRLRRQGRVLLGRSGRRRRHRETTGGVQR